MSWLDCNLISDETKKRKRKLGRLREPCLNNGQCCSILLGNTSALGQYFGCWALKK